MYNYSWINEMLWVSEIENAYFTRDNAANRKTQILIGDQYCEIRKWHGQETTSIEILLIKHHPEIMRMKNVLEIICTKEELRIPLALDIIDRVICCRAP